MANRAIDTDDLKRSSHRVLADLRRAVRATIAKKYAAGQPVYSEVDGKIYEFRGPNDKGHVVETPDS